MLVWVKFVISSVSIRTLIYPFWFCHCRRTLCGFWWTRCKPRLGDIQRHSQRSWIRWFDRFVNSWNGFSPWMGSSVQRWAVKIIFVEMTSEFNCSLFRKIRFGWPFIKGNECRWRSYLPFSLTLQCLYFSPVSNQQATQTKTTSQLDHLTSRALNKKRRIVRERKMIPSQKSENCHIFLSNPRHQKQIDLIFLHYLLQNFSSIRT